MNEWHVVFIGFQIAESTWIRQRFIHDTNDIRHGAVRICCVIVLAGQQIGADRMIIRIYAGIFQRFCHIVADIGGIVVSGLPDNKVLGVQTEIKEGTCAVIASGLIPEIRFVSEICSIIRKKEGNYNNCDISCRSKFCQEFEF